MALRPPMQAGRRTWRSAPLASMTRNLAARPGTKSLITLFLREDHFGAAKLLEFRDTVDGSAVNANVPAEPVCNSLSLPQRRIYLGRVDRNSGGLN